MIKKKTTLKKAKKPSAKNIKKGIIKIIKKITSIQDDVSDMASIRDDLNIDSIMTMEIIANIDRKYGIQIEEGNIIKIKTVGEFLSYIDRLICDKYAISEK